MKDLPQLSQHSEPGVCVCVVSIRAPWNTFKYHSLSLLPCIRTKVWFSCMLTVKTSSRNASHQGLGSSSEIYHLTEEHSLRMLLLWNYNFMPLQFHSIILKFRVFVETHPDNLGMAGHSYHFLKITFNLFLLFIHLSNTLSLKVSHSLMGMC